jgi:GntR family transcriptional regulator of abcA and norABC
MAWKPDAQSNFPVFLQIAQHLEKQIVEGQLQPGEMLPPERSLAKSLNVNRSTITAAYDELRAAGLIRSTQGSGTRVSEDVWGVSARPSLSWHEYTSGGVFRPTLAMVSRIREVSHDEHVINLARGELSPDLFPVHALTEVMTHFRLPQKLGYLEANGSHELRQILVGHLHEHLGIQAAPSEILITTGAQQAIHLITSCLLKPGDAVAVEYPSYTYSLSLFTSAGLRLFPIPMDNQGLIPDDIPQLVKKHRIRMVFINPTFHNPTGTTLTMSRRKDLLRICESLRLPIVEDDPYAGLSFESHQPPPPLAAMTQRTDQVIYLGSLSKTIAPALRIGWVHGPSNVIRRLADAKGQMDFGTSSITQQIAHGLLASGAWHENVMHLQKILKQRRDTMLMALEDNLKESLAWTIPQGGYHIWGKLKSSVRDADLLEASIRHGVVVTPGGVYGADQGHVRLTYARVADAAIVEGIARLRSALNEITVS